MGPDFGLYKSAVAAKKALRKCQLRLSNAYRAYYLSFCSCPCNHVGCHEENCPLYATGIIVPKKPYVLAQMPRPSRERFHKG